MHDANRISLADRISKRATSVRPWQRSLKSLVAEAFDQIEALPRVGGGYFLDLADAFDRHIEQEFRLDMTQSRERALAALSLNPQDEEAKALLSWVEELEAKPPIRPVHLPTLRETVYRERRDRRKVGLYEKVVHGLRPLFKGRQDNVEPPPEAVCPPECPTQIQPNDLPLLPTPSRDEPSAPQPRRPDPAGEPNEIAPPGEAALMAADLLTTSPSMDEVDSTYSLLNSERGATVEQVDETRPIRPRKMS